MSLPSAILSGHHISRAAYSSDAFKTYTLVRVSKHEQPDSLNTQEPHSVRAALGASKIESRNISYSVFTSTIRALKSWPPTATVPSVVLPLELPAYRSAQIVTERNVSEGKRLASAFANALTRRRHRTIMKTVTRKSLKWKLTTSNTNTIQMSWHTAMRLCQITTASSIMFASLYTTLKSRHHLLISSLARQKLMTLDGELWMVATPTGQTNNSRTSCTQSGKQVKQNHSHATGYVCNFWPKSSRASQAQDFWILRYCTESCTTTLTLAPIT